MKVIWVEAKAHKYPIYVGHQILSQAELFRPFILQHKVLLITHPELATHYLTRLEQSFTTLGVDFNHLLIPAGESHKNIDSAQKIWSFLLDQAYHRDTVVVALGGGMIGDLAGFSAACFMRGVPVIQCPTTLLSQIDSAIGGKTAINHAAGKNLIGAFHPPVAVIADLATLATLPQREFISGLAELIKYAVTLDEDFFAWLESAMPAILQRDLSVLAEAIEWGCRLKAQVVAVDEFDQNQRLVLNFGHTIAHSLESLLTYKNWLHGEAVAIGMIAAGHLSLEKGWITKATLDRLIFLLEAAQLPIKLNLDVTAVEILAKLKHDKKHLQQKLRWVLLKAVGQASFCNEITPHQIIAALMNCGAKGSPLTSNR